ncbi:MAG TPA: hypothetical protein VE195_01520, partial [Acidobacteriaceae bacterium]|nr:hypothetical protein [Acidobacteriaceae bacterium]
LSSFQIALLEFLVYLAPQETINLTFVVLPTSLLLGMIWLVIEADQVQSWLRIACMIGAIGGALVSLKSTYLPIVGVYALIPCFAASWQARRPRRISSPIVAGLSALAVLLAWMIAMKMTSGTYLFPVLGSGVDYSSYGLFHVTARFYSHRALVKVFLQAFALLILILVQFIFGTRNFNFRISLWILATSAIAITAFNYRTGGDFIWRYNFPQFLCAIVVFYAATGSAFRQHPNSNRGRVAFYVGILSLAGMVFYYDAAGSSPRPFRQMGIEEGDYVRSLRASLSGGSLASPTLRSEYRAAEQTIPYREAALENVARPYLFDFGRHKIYMMDWPGAASPSEAWPFDGNESSLVSYLLRHSIRYLIYDYEYARWEDVEACQALESPTRNSQELISLWWMSVLTDHQFDQLQPGYVSIYDDGKIAVIDLERPRTDAPAPTAVWTADTSKDQICSAVLARYLANPLPQPSK